MSALATDTGGNLYGATLAGGKGHDPSIFGGIVFELSPGPTWSETVLYNFCTKGQGKNCTDGTGPGGGVTFDRLGNLYGVAGGGSQENRQGGIVYKLVPSSNGWIETLYSFPSGGDGDCASPTGEVSLGRSGEVYGTLFYGGNGFGCVFRLRSNGTFEGTAAFSETNGAFPPSGVLLVPSENAAYGVTTGIHDTEGNIFQVSGSSQIISLYNFCQQSNCTDGSEPMGSLIRDGSGNLYGTAQFGGTGGCYEISYGPGCGVVFRITP
jgi:hypothetical protein